jgi:hypothetical protein
MMLRGALATVVGMQKCRQTSKSLPSYPARFLSSYTVGNALSEFNVMPYMWLGVRRPLIDSMLTTACVSLADPMLNVRWQSSASHCLSQHPPSPLSSFEPLHRPREALALDPVSPRPPRH